MQLHEQFDHVLERSGLRTYYVQESKGQLESRVENLDELVSVASRFERRADEEAEGMSELVAFLAYAALEAGEGQAEAGEDGVQLMTLHSAKGLEFPLVFLVGLEEGVFPGQRSAEDAGRLEEERRLAYVGLTRARQRLVLTWAESRRIHGSEMLRRAVALPARDSRRRCCARCGRARVRARRWRRASAMPAMSPASAPGPRCGSASASRTRASAPASSPTAKAAARMRACR